MFNNNKAIISPIDSNIAIEGIVEEFNEEKITIILKDKDNQLAEGQGLEIYLFNKFRGELKYKGIIKKVETYRLIIENLETLYTKQRRNEVRVNVLFPVKIYEIFHNNELMTLDKYIYGNIINISVSGMLFKSSLDLPSGLRFLLALKIESTEINVAAEIIRKEFKENKYLYGCSFSTADPEHENIIRQFVTKKQIEERRNAKQN